MGGRGQRGVTENVGHLRARLRGTRRGGEGEVTLGFPVKVTEGRRDKEQKQEQSCGMTLRLRYDQSLTSERNCRKELSHASGFPTVHLGWPFHSRTVPRPQLKRLWEHFGPNLLFTDSALGRTWPPFISSSLFSRPAGRGLSPTQTCQLHGEQIFLWHPGRGLAQAEGERRGKVKAFCVLPIQGTAFTSQKERN